jgi:hypothetical protein
MNETAIDVATGLFKSVIPQNDRYAVYQMVNRTVIFRHPVTGVRVDGLVDEVYRDIFTNEVRLTINGEHIRFKEPDQIRFLDREVIFVYGNANKREVTDKTLFKEMRKDQFRDTVDGTMKRLNSKRCMEIRFILGVKKVSRRKYLPLKSL